MHAIIVSVNYADLLAITLPYNREQFDRVTVVTSMEDTATADVVTATGCELLQTDLFYAHGATFNKFAALEYAVTMSRLAGWACFLDADIMIPKNSIRLTSWRRNHIYSPYRRMWYDITQSPPPEHEWCTLPYGTPKHDNYHAGYMQIFDTQDPVLRKRPWYRLNCDNASSGDTEFSRKWNKARRLRPSFEVLHLGHPGKNWCGRQTPYVDGSIPVEAAERGRAMHQFYENKRRKK